ncbi:B3 domain-containing protein [Trifolium pratense]|uniref:B3 domain-containing protein n=1 Tax=Trifolium pratense TaxID=57577 RepID=A0A2K3L7K2_TRIPR|nr:B3 domain-containing protein At2g33720-like [Trifolium pratense]PNX74512.1 B3 domain-containing protein [Trifolium pratense]
MASRINIPNDFVCVCLSLGGGSCRRFPFRCLTFDEIHFPFRCLRMNNNSDDQWEIKKALEWSDCSRLSRLLLNKDLANVFVIPVLMGGAEAAKQKGVEVQVWDVDTKSLHSLVFRIWPSAQTHVFIKTWFDDFVLRRELKKGDVIGLHWDQANQRFNFSVLYRRSN